MGKKYHLWSAKCAAEPSTFDECEAWIRANRTFQSVDKLEYGDHGLAQAVEAILQTIKEGKRIALYADYDVDGTMSCVSWIWFLRAIGYQNFVHYIPDRFKEGYGVNLDAIKHLVENEKAGLIITMDTGITANIEAQYCRERGVVFICTDHHKIQPDKMPDSIILNPKLHPDPDYQELCGCGVTFVLLRKLGQYFSVPPATWTDLLALVGMATVCDVVPLNGVNHKLVKLGVEALQRSTRPIFKKLLVACQMLEKGDEKDVGFRLGPRINAVGRLEHAHAVIDAFLSEDPELLVTYMGICNERRKTIQQQIFEEADALARAQGDVPILFLGGDWHPGVLGIAAAKIAEKYWKPVWLFNNQDEKLCKGSARSIPGFDVTEAMVAAKDAFVKFGGHRAAGGFSFCKDQLTTIQERMSDFAMNLRQAQPNLWQSSLRYDFQLPDHLLSLQLADSMNALKPFGHGFEEPKFMLGPRRITKTKFFNDKRTGKPKHTAVFVEADGQEHKIMFFNEVHPELRAGATAQFIVSASRNTYLGAASLNLYGLDFGIDP